MGYACETKTLDMPKARAPAAKPTSSGLESLDTSTASGLSWQRMVVVRAYQAMAATDRQATRKPCRRSSTRTMRSVRSRWRRDVWVMRLTTAAVMSDSPLRVRTQRTAPSSIHAATRATWRRALTCSAAARIRAPPMTGGEMRTKYASPYAEMSSAEAHVPISSPCTR